LTNALLRLSHRKEVILDRIAMNQLFYPGDGLYYSRDQPFTGIAFYQSSEGWISGEDEFRDGLRWGRSRRWHKADVLKHEEECVKGVRHGVLHDWHANGQLSGEEIYEHGIKTSGRHWDSQGGLRKEFKLKESDPAFRALEEVRKAQHEQ
jgi:antitoxin component YwqK of YwqJK toxin-antitoxin module